MSKKEILRLYREDAGYNVQDLISMLDSKLDGGTTRSLDDSLVIFHLGELVVAVSPGGVEFFHQNSEIPQEANRKNLIEKVVLLPE